MSLNKISLVIASRSPKKLAEFYALLTKGEISKGLTSKDFYVSHCYGIDIHIYKPSQNRAFPNKGNALTFCLNSEPKDDPIKFIEGWQKKLISLGAFKSGNIRSEIFGVETFMTDPEGNLFLLLVPNLLCHKY